MTISQALRKAAKLRGQIKEYLERAAASNVWEADQLPAFTFSGSIEEADASIRELVKIETAIRVANATHFVEHEGRTVTLTEATCVLREMKGRIAWLKALTSRAQTSTRETSLEYDEDTMKRRQVVKTFSCVLPKAKVAEMIATVQAEFDALNDAVETVNHRVVVKL